MPVVSIVMPTRNHAVYIGEAIDSVLAQTYPHWELLIVDDESTDETASVVAGKRDDRIRYMRRRMAGNVARSRNAAIGVARGELIAFLDSDDAWAATKLERQVAMLLGDPGLGLCYVLFERRFEDGSLDGPHPAEPLRARGAAFADFYSRFVAANSGVMVRRTVLDMVGTLDEDPRLIAAEDTHLWMRISAVTRVDYVPGEPLLQYRVRRQSLYHRLSPWERFRKSVVCARKLRVVAGPALYGRRLLLIAATLIDQTTRNWWNPNLRS